MGKKFSIFVMMAVLSIAFSGTVMGADNKNEPAKQSIIDKMKSAYGNFMARAEKKDEKTQAAQPAAVVKQESPKAVTQANIAAEPKAVIDNKAGQKTAETKTKTPITEKTSKEELIADLKDELESDEEVFDIMPDLKAAKDETGNMRYTYKGGKIEDMSEGDLSGLLAKVRQAGIKLRTERIQQQLETVRRAQEVQKISAPRTPPRVPPTVVQQTSTPPSAPKAPPAPPLPPRR